MTCVKFLLGYTGNVQLAFQLIACCCQHLYLCDSNHMLYFSLSCAAGEASPDSAAVKQLLHVVEGLEEELFTSEARRNDAEVAFCCLYINSVIDGIILCFAEC